MNGLTAYARTRGGRMAIERFTAQLDSSFVDLFELDRPTMRWDGVGFIEDSEESQSVMGSS